MKIKLFTVCIAMSLLAIPTYAQSNNSGSKLLSDKRKAGSKSQVKEQISRMVTLDSCFKIDISKDGKERQLPFVFKFGKNIFVSYSEHHDAVMAYPVDAMMISRDNGKTWSEKITQPDFYLTSMFKKDGILYGIVYFTYPDSPTQERMVYWTSGDEGKSWVKHNGIVNASENKQFKTTDGIWGSILFHRGMKVMDDGSIRGVMYGHYDGDEKYRVVWAKSNDNCATWQIVSTIAAGFPVDSSNHAEGYCEPTFAKTHDGSILCVMRIGSYLPLYQSRSYDNGTTWSKPVVLPGLTGKSLESVDPNLVLMKNGILALTYGRPGTRIAFSDDGCGYHWDFSMDTYTKETTGYSGIVETGKDSLLLIADQGRTGAKEMAIWGRFIHVNVVSTGVTGYQTNK
ncbi:MAG: sialidase family protein [Ginsengibacter sp.]